MIQLNILWEIIKKNLVLIGSLLFFVGLEVIVYYFGTGNPFRIEESLYCFPGKKIELIGFYKSAILIVLIYQLYTYEIKNNFIYIFNRTAIGRWFFFKIIFILLMIILYNFLYMLIIFLLVPQVVSFSWDFVMRFIIFELFLSVFVVMLTNIVQLKSYAPYIVIVLILLLFERFDFLYFGIAIAVLFVINILLIFKTGALKKIVS